MGEAKRRAMAATGQGDLAGKLLAVPIAERERLADEIGDTAFLFEETGGTCAPRAVLAQHVLAERLGVTVPIVIGGMIYRAGDDPTRDLVAFCGRDNRLLQMGHGMLGHYWLEAGGVVLDFSLPDWRTQAEALAEVEAQQMGKHMGTAEFTAPLPRYIWGRRGEGALLLTRPGEPPPGHAYYTPEPRPPAGVAALLQELREMIQAMRGTPRGTASEAAK